MIDREQHEARTGNAGGEGTAGNDYAKDQADQIAKDANDQRIQSAANGGQSSS